MGDDFKEQLAEISKNQKETNERLTMLLDKLVGDPLSKRKGWVSIIEENTEEIITIQKSMSIHDKRLQKLEEKKSKVGSTLLASLGTGGSGAIIASNWASIKKFIINLLNSLT